MAEQPAGLAPDNEIGTLMVEGEGGSRASSRCSAAFFAAAGFAPDGHRRASDAGAPEIRLTRPPG